MIVLHGVTKALGEAGPRLGPLDVRLPAGRRVGILGAPGSGKSSLIRLLTGRLLPDAGRIERRGRLSPPLGATAILDPRLSGAGNAAAAARLHGLRPATVVAAVAAFADVGTWLDGQPARVLSAGQRSRLALAIALALDCDTLLADGSPESGDAPLRAACRRAVLETCADGRRGLVLATASPATLRAYCEVALVLHAGRLHPFATPGEAVAFLRAVTPPDHSSLAHFSPALSFRGEDG